MTNIVKPNNVLKIIQNPTNNQEVCWAVAIWLNGNEWRQNYREVCAALENYRFYEISAQIQKSAFLEGTNPYDAAYGAISFWKSGLKTNFIENYCQACTQKLEEINFIENGDDFHKRMTKEALKDTLLLARFEANELDFAAILKRPLHSIAVTALLERAWMLHNSLEGEAARKLVLLYIQLTNVGPEYELYLFRTFFANEYCEQVIQRLEAFPKDNAEDLAPNAYKARVYYEAAKFTDLETLYIEAARQVQTTEMEFCVVGYFCQIALFFAKHLLDIGKTEEAIEICDSLLEHRNIGGNSGAVYLALGEIYSHFDLEAASANYSKSQLFSPSITSPFGIPSVDFYVAQNDWQTAYKITEGFSSSIRNFYTSILPDALQYSTASTDTMPKSALVLSGWGLGDDIFRLGLLRNYLSDGNYTMMLDSRLIKMAKAALPDWNFLSHSRINEVGRHEFWRHRQGVAATLDPLRVTFEAISEAKRHCAILVQEDLQALHFAQMGKSNTSTQAPILKPDDEKIMVWKDWLDESGEMPKVAICWRSGLLGTSRGNSFFSNQEIAKIMQDMPVRWVLLQYDWEIDEINEIEKLAQTKFLKPPNLDLKNDIEGVAALSLACDLVLSTGVSTRELCAAAGANVFSISFGWPFANYCRRNEDTTDKIFPNLTHPNSWNRQEIILQARDLACKL